MLISVNIGKKKLTREEREELNKWIRFENIYSAVKEDDLDEFVKSFRRVYKKDGLSIEEILNALQVRKEIK